MVTGARSLDWGTRRRLRDLVCDGSDTTWHPRLRSAGGKGRGARWRMGKEKGRGWCKYARSK